MFIDSEYETQLSKETNDEENEVVTFAFTLRPNKQGDDVVVDDIVYVGNDDSIYHEEALARTLINAALNIAVFAKQRLGSHLLTVTISDVYQTEEEDAFEIIEGKGETSYRLISEQYGYEFSELVLSQL